MRLRAIVALILLAGILAPCRAATSIYVESFGGTGNGADLLRSEMIRLLKARKDVSIASTEAAADRVLTGVNQIFIKGYLSRNPRVRYRTSDSRPVYGGYVSLELKDRNDDTVWSYLITPSRFGSEDINRNLADQIVSRLIEFLSNPTKTP